MKYNKTEPHYLVREQCTECRGTGEKCIGKWPEPFKTEPGSTCDECAGNGYIDKWIGQEDLQERMGLDRRFWENYNG